MNRYLPVAITVICALYFGFLMFLPNVLQRMDSQFPYQEIEMMPTDAEAHYAARVREPLDGFPRVANTFLSEPKVQQYLQPPLPEIASAGMISLLPFSFPTSFVLVRSLCAIILFLVIVAVACIFSGNIWISLLAASALCFGGSLLSAPWNLLDIFSGEIPSFEFLRFMRPINPLWTLPWTFGAIGLMASWLRERRTWKAVCSALVTVLLLYSYLYAWTFIGAMMIVFLIWSLWKRDTRRVWDLLLFAGIFVLCGIPYFINLWGTMHHPLYLETAPRLGMVNKREVVLGAWAITLVVLAPLSKRLWPKIFPLVPALAFASVLTLNQQLLTGKYMVPHHYHWYFVFPFAALFFLLFLLHFINKAIPRLHKHWFCGTALIVACIFGTFQQVTAYNDVREYWGALQSHGPVLQDLASRLQPGDVVLASDASFLRELIPIYTSADVYASVNMGNYLIPSSRLRDTFYLDLWLEQTDPEDAENLFKNALRWRVSSRTHYIYWREEAGDYANIPDTFLEKYAEEYAQYARLPLKEKLEKYPLHYIVLTPEDPVTPPLRSIIAQAKILYEKDGYFIYEMSR